MWAARRAAHVGDGGETGGEARTLGEEMPRVGHVVVRRGRHHRIDLLEFVFEQLVLQRRDQLVECLLSVADRVEVARAAWLAWRARSVVQRHGDRGDTRRPGSLLDRSDAQRVEPRPWHGEAH